MDRSAAATAPPLTLEQLEAFYTTQYRPLVRLLVVLGATIEEAEDAVQKAMTDFTWRSRSSRVPAHPAAYVQKAAIRYFVKERQRERERLPRELRSGLPVMEEHVDHQMTQMEDNQYIEHLLSCLTPTQQKAIKLVMDGLSTREIAEELGKSDQNVRQHLKNGRDRLKAHPDIAPLAPEHKLRDLNAARQGAQPTAITPEPRKEGVE